MRLAPGRRHGPVVPRVRRRVRPVLRGHRGSLRPVTAGQPHEWPLDQPGRAVANALAEVEAGQIAYLTRAGRPVAALVPVTELAELQRASDSTTIAEAQAVRARRGPRIPHEVVEAMMSADDATHDAMATILDARSGDDLPPDEVRVIWETISTRTV